MKMIKIALLGTAALAAVSVSARASEASDIAALKAQVEALSAKVAANDVQYNIPAGFQLMTIGTQTATVVPGLINTKNDGKTATVMSIMPTADAPASTTIEWNGFVRAAFIYSQDDGDPSTWDIVSRARLVVVGKTDTAVGEVGARVAFLADSKGIGALNRGNSPLSTDGYWGWWKMTPELTLGAGVDGTLAGIGYGYDGACTCYYTDFAPAGYGHDGDPTQVRLSYASGPFSAAIAVEDYTNTATQSNLGVAGEVKYAGDMVSGEVSAGYWSPDTAGVKASWLVGAGLSFALGDIGKISASAGVGHDNDSSTKYGWSDTDYWRANILASINLSEQAHAEVGFNHFHVSDNPGTPANDINSVLAGIYYDPVKQLTIGLEGEWAQESLEPGAPGQQTRADLVTVFRF